MSNYFLTTTFGPSKTISCFPLQFMWEAFMCSTVSELGKLVAAKPETYESNSLHMQVEYYYVFKTWLAW